MARIFSLMTCVMLFLAVEHSVQAADSITVKESTLNDGSSSGGGLGAVVTELTASIMSLKEDLQKTNLKLKKTEQNLQETQQTLQETRRDLKAVEDSHPGSTFVRWGRKTCPAKTALVYSGVAGGKHIDEKGSGTNRLCLTSSPQFDNTPIPPYYSYLYGGEYQEIENNLDYEVPCAVCRATQPITIMMSTTLTCPRGWTAQYTGHLTAQSHSYYATEYVCLDRDPENYSRRRFNNDQATFYYVVTMCGTLPCPPYQNRKLATCVVCSK